MPTSLLDYFPEAKGDGLRVTWARGTNNKARLASALRSKLNYTFFPYKTDDMFSFFFSCQGVFIYYIPISIWTPVIEKKNEVYSH